MTAASRGRRGAARQRQAAAASKLSIAPARPRVACLRLKRKALWQHSTLRGTQTILHRQELRTQGSIELRVEIELRYFTWDRNALFHMSYQHRVVALVLLRSMGGSTHVRVCARRWRGLGERGGCSYCQHTNGDGNSRRDRHQRWVACVAKEGSQACFFSHVSAEIRLVELDIYFRHPHRGPLRRRCRHRHRTSPPPTSPPPRQTSTDLPIHVNTIEEYLPGPKSFARHSQLEGAQVAYFPSPFHRALSSAAIPRQLMAFRGTGRRR